MCSFERKTAWRDQAFASRRAPQPSPGERTARRCLVRNYQTVLGTPLHIPPRWRWQSGLWRGRARRLSHA
eukprot:scaffold15149_cov106-Isochrysis_galbana.AAC.3